MKHQGLVYRLCNKFYRRNSLYDLEDLVQIANIAVVKAIRAYNPSRGAISTLIYYCIYHDLIRFTQSNHKKEISLSNNISYSAHGLFEFIPTLGNYEQKFLKLILDGYSRSEILTLLNISIGKYRKTIKFLRRRFTENA